MRVELSLLGYGNDPASTTDNSKLSEDQVRWLDERRVGQLAIASLQVDDHELVIRDHYPGFIRVFSYGWDGYTYSFHSIDEAVNRRARDGQRVRVSGRSYCALYGRFDSWMKYEYELRLDDDGVGCETLTLIPEQDTDFSPHRNGRPNNYSGIGSSLSGLSFAARVTRPVFATALVAPFADIEPKEFAVSDSNRNPIYEGPVDGAGALAGYNPDDQMFFGLLADGRDSDAAGKLVREQDGNRNSVHFEIMRPIASAWSAGSRNTFRRWFTAGRARDLEAAIRRIERARKKVHDAAAPQEQTSSR